jgi:hypothetical protein
MYEKPKVVPVGEVEKVVRGFLPVGDDIDGTWTIPEQGFEGEVEEDEAESQ